MNAGIFELAVVILVAAVLGVAAKFFRQPIILAYLATGVLMGYLGWTKVIDQETFHVFSNLGVMFLLFLVGLEINYDSLRLVGRQAVILGVSQIIFTFMVGYGMAWLFGFSAVPAAYIAIALTISSTVIVVKLLSERQELHSLSGRLALGILLVQDFVVILLLVFLSGFATGKVFSWSDLAATAAKGIALFAFMFYLGRKLIPFLVDKIARSQELLFLISLAWVFLLAAFVQKIGFSIEIAGFLAGLSLANASEHFQIASRIRPLRDFFILIFFALLGSRIAVADLTGITWPILAFSLFVLVGNPLIVISIMGLMGYRKRTGFLTGIAIAQISEFSLVLVALGRSIGHVSDTVVSLVTAVGIVTITVSSYFITHADTIFRRVHRHLSFFERRVTKEMGMPGGEVARPVVLIGAHRTGQVIAANLHKEHLLVIDFDPAVIASLRANGFHYLFGDIADPDIFEKANFDRAHLVISTSPNYEDNLSLIERLAEFPNRPRIIVRAEDESEARGLYKHGADYVLLPNFTAGQYLGKTIAFDPQLRILDQLKRRDLAMLKSNHHYAMPYGTGHGEGRNGRGGHHLGPLPTPPPSPPEGYRIPL